MFISSNHIRLFKRFIFLLIPYALLRIGFYLYHANIYRPFTKTEILESFLLGIRFDVAAILLVNLPLIFLSFIPQQSHRIYRLERWLFILLNTAGVIVSLNDYELFLFMGKRFSFDLFVIIEDIWAQLPQLFLYYWYFPLFAALIGIAFHFLDKIFFHYQDKKNSLWVHLISSLVFAGLSFIGIRGGLQHKSINVQSAFTQGKNELGHLVLNSPYHFFRTLKNKSIKKLTYFEDDNQARKIIVNKLSEASGIEGKKQANVVLIILESFSLEYMEQGYTPFLNELKKDSLFLEHHLANGRRSIEALPSVLCGLPALLAEPISKSIFQGNRFTCVPQVLKNNGYTNYFFHGGARGTMGFESYTLANGFDRYFSRDDYPLKEDFDGTWGIYDEPYLQHVADNLQEIPEPFFAGIFTLSSHQPYAVPLKFKGKFPKGKLEIHESIGYADYALRKFFERIKTSAWFKNTIFIITADHAQKLETAKFQNLIGHYRVPLLLYAPGYKWSKKSIHKVTQHSDIPATILDFVEVQGSLPLTSQSVFSSGEGVGINFADGSVYYLLTSNTIHLFNPEKGQTQAHYDWKTGQISSPVSTADPLLKAYLQYFVNGLINNNLSR
jgi:phosphoglycerol transferase MdoB-like AlkP superfamily enzyme